MSEIKVFFKFFVVLVKDVLVLVSTDMAGKVLFVHMQSKLDVIEERQRAEIAERMWKNLHLCLSSCISVVMMIVHLANMVILLFTNKHKSAL